MSKFTQIKLDLNDHFGEIKESFSKIEVGDLLNIVLTLEQARERGNFVFLAGNGGSAATASHFANDLIKMCGVKAVCLNDLVSPMTAYANDEGYYRSFLGILEVLARPDLEEAVFIGISCSGSSKNVVDCAIHMQYFGIGPVIALTGASKGDLLKHAEIAVEVEGNIRVQEDVHLAICHAVAGALKNA